MDRNILLAARLCGRLVARIVLVIVLLLVPAAAASARGYFDGGAVLADSPTSVANDGTVYAFRFSATNTPDEPGTLYPTPDLAKNTTYHVKIRFTTNWQNGEPASTDNRGFMWNWTTSAWVFWDADWPAFPTVTTDGNGNIAPDQWIYCRFSDTTRTGKYGLLVSLSIGGTGSTLNGRTWAIVDVYDPRTGGGWVHSGADTAAAALTPVRIYAHGASATPVAAALTEANGCDDDANGVVDDEKPGPVKTGGFRAGVPTGQLLDASLDGVLWPGSTGFTLTMPDTDLALGASDQTAPTASGSLTAAPRNGAAVLTWAAATDAKGVTGYRIYRWIPAPLGSTYTADPVPLATVGATTTYKDTTAANGTDYSYFVRALDGATNVGPRSATATVTPDGTPPGPATSLVATAGDRQVQLTWAKPADADLAGVRIVRKTGLVAPAGPDDGTAVYEGPLTTTTDVGLTNGATYTYAAFAYDTAQNFAATGPTAAATPNLATALALSATPKAVGWGGAWSFSGALTTAAGAALPDAPVELQQSLDGGATWTSVSGSPLTPVAGANVYSGSGPTLVQTTQFRLRYGGDVQHVGCVSAPVTVTTRAGLGTPAAPSRATRKKSFSVKGSLAPQPTSGLAVKIRCYQLVRRSWKLKKTVGAKLAAGDPSARYSAVLSLPARGSWKLVAYVPSSTKFAATTSGARKVTVR
jgi:hypothetical protein